MVERGEVWQEIEYWIDEKGFEKPKEEDMEALNRKVWEIIDQQIEDNLEEWAEDEQIVLIRAKKKEKEVI